MKYHNKKTTVDGIAFDSAAEARRYAELKLLERAGKIKDLKLQPMFELLPAFQKNGKRYRKTTYIADFSYFDNESMKNVVEDVKGVKTQIYSLKKKLFEYRYPDLTLTEVKA